MKTSLEWQQSTRLQVSEAAASMTKEYTTLQRESMTDVCLCTHVLHQGACLKFVGDNTDPLNNISSLARLKLKLTYYNNNNNRYCYYYVIT